MYWHDDGPARLVEEVVGQSPRRAVRLGWCVCDCVGIRSVVAVVKESRGRETIGMEASSAPTHAPGSPARGSFNPPHRQASKQSPWLYALHFELLDLLGLRHVGVAAELGPEHVTQRDALGALLSWLLDETFGGSAGLGARYVRPRWMMTGASARCDRQSIEPSDPCHMPHAPCSRCGRPRAGSHGTAACAVEVWWCIDG